MAAGIGHTLFLSDPENDLVKKLDEFHPEVEVEDSKSAEDIEADDSKGSLAIVSLPSAPTQTNLPLHSANVCTTILVPRSKLASGCFLCENEIGISKQRQAQ